MDAEISLLTESNSRLQNFTAFTLIMMTVQNMIVNYTKLRTCFKDNIEKTSKRHLEILNIAQLYYDHQTDVLSKSDTNHEKQS